MNRPQIWLDDSGISTRCQAADMFVGTSLCYTMPRADSRAAALVECLESPQRHRGIVTRTMIAGDGKRQVNGHETATFFP
jgi:hypothetical protein